MAEFGITVLITKLYFNNCNAKYLLYSDRSSNQSFSCYYIGLLRAANENQIQWVDGKSYEFNIPFDNNKLDILNDEDYCYCVYLATNNHLPLKLKEEKCFEAGTYLCETSGKSVLDSFNFLVVFF